jgi:beta-phosphoglucomutase family hydrolase
MQQRAVIWDLDGTLIDSVAYHWQAWRAVMEAEKFVYTHADFVADFGKRNDEILRLRVDAAMSEAEIARIALAKEEQYRHLVRTQGLELLPGGADWLERLRDDGWLQALGTSAPRGNVEAVFDAIAMEQYFAAVMSSEQVKQGKPAPDVFLAAAAQMGVAPEHCFVVEDAPAGIEAARRAGMTAVGVCTTHPDLEADWVFSSLAEMPRDFFVRLVA